MNKEQAKKLPKKLPSITDDLPEYLKDPANYEKVKKIIFDSFATTCSHSDILEFAKCKICSDKMLERRKTLKKLGFKNPRQYMAWQKTHEEIRHRFPLLDWKTENANRLVEALKNNK